MDENNPKPLERYRPYIRPSMALLTIYDDGVSEGEVVRIRRDYTVIGRDRGHILIQHDPGISSPHVSITRSVKDERSHWRLEDLKSKTGLWVRVRKTELRDGVEFMAGRSKFRFKAAITSLVSNSSLEQRILGGSIPGNTQFDRSDANHVGSAYASIELVSAIPSRAHAPRLHLIDGEYWIGRDPACAIPFVNDTFLATHHVRIHLENEKWFAEARARGTPNGMWIHVDSLNVHKSCAFQIGEQRFHLNCHLVETEHEQVNDDN